MSEANYLELLPAVDVKDGRAVRLVQGELARESVYGQPHHHQATRSHVLVSELEQLLHRGKP